MRASTVRPCAPDEIDRVVGLLGEAWRQEAHRALVAVDVGGVVGAILLRSIADTAEVLMFRVDDAHRRLGVGRQLLSEALSHAQHLGATTVHLEVRDDNTAARALYSSVGFVITGKRRAYYEDGVDALAMTIRLSP